MTVAGLTARLTLVLCVAAPAAPVMVSVYVPAAVPLVVFTVSVDVPAGVTDAGLNDAVAPAGRPPIDKFTVLLKPLMLPTVTVYVVLFPAVTVCEDGDAEIEKSETMTVTVAECDRLPLVPVMVTG